LPPSSSSHRLQVLVRQPGDELPTLSVPVKVMGGQPGAHHRPDDLWARRSPAAIDRDVYDATAGKPASFRHLADSAGSCLGRPQEERHRKGFVLPQAIGGTSTARNSEDHLRVPGCPCRAPRRGLWLIAIDRCRACRRESPRRDLRRREAGGLRACWVRRQGGRLNRPMRGRAGFFSIISLTNWRATFECRVRLPLTGSARRSPPARPSDQSRRRLTPRRPPVRRRRGSPPRRSSPPSRAGAGRAARRWRQAPRPCGKPVDDRSIYMQSPFGSRRRTGPADAEIVLDLRNPAPRRCPMPL